MNKIFLAILFSVALAFQSKGQISIGAEVSPTFSNILTDKDYLKRDYVFSVNYGIRANYETKLFQYSIGVFHLKQGGKYEIERTSPTQPDGTGEIVDVYDWTKSIMVPVNFDVFLLKKENTKLYTGLGFYSGYIYSQERDFDGDPFDFEMFNDFYFGLNFGVGLKQQLNNSLGLTFRPNVLYQLSGSKKELVADFNMMSFLLDIGIYYTIP